MPNFPFTRAKALGWSLFEVLTSAQMSQVDANAAQAADGLVWTDAAALRTWSPIVTTSQVALSILYSAYTDVWYAFAVSAGNPSVFTRFGAAGLWTAGALSAGNPAAGAGLTPRKRAVAADPVQKIVVIGGLPGSSSNQKYRRLDENVMTWSTPASSQTSTASVDCIAWVPAIGLFVAGLSDGKVETSPDGTTWTLRTTPNANARTSIAVGPINGSSGGILMGSSVATNTLIHSVDGINWTQRTLSPGFPSSEIVVYVPLLGQYSVMNNGIGALNTSPDGITWTSRVRTLPIALVTGLGVVQNSFAAFGRTIMLASYAPSLGLDAVIYSQDGGLTWRLSAAFAATTTSIGPLAANGYQVQYCVAFSTGIVSSIAGGF